MFVSNRYGDMYTRKYDLDLAGANHIPGRYTWQEQGPLPSAPSQLQERFDPRYAAISLPVGPWSQQPKIPGESTSRISVVDAGPRLEDRELRVEGRSGGHSGYWHKPLESGAWQFAATGEPLRGRPLTEADPARDQSSLTLAPPTGAHYSGALPDGWSARISDFDWAQTTHQLTLASPTGREYPALLHTTDGLRLLPRGDGLDQEPRALEGALDLRRAEPRAAGNDELGAFVDAHLAGREIFEVDVQATTEQLVISPSGLFTAPLGVWHRH